MTAETVNAFPGNAHDRMNSVPLSSLRPDTIATMDYYSHNAELLIPRGVLITARHLAMLEKRNNFDLFTSPVTVAAETGESDTRNPSMETPAIPFMTESERLFLSISDPSGEKHRALDIFNIEPGSSGLARLDRSEIALALDSRLQQHPLIDRPAGTPLKNKTSQLVVAERTEGYKDEVSRLYTTALQETRNLLRLLARNNNADARAIDDLVKQFIRIFITDRNILLNISSIKTPGDDYLFHHSLNVCLLAINIAAAYGYSERQVLEIGTGAIVHDIGMLLIPSELRMKQARLTDEEWCEIRKHPILGLHLLQKLKNMSDRIPYITYQVHERENATGYPRQHRSSLIHRFAKMVQVADIYEALTSQRPHRPPYLPDEAILKIVQMTQKKLIPIDAVRAFVEYVSLFPVGSLVELSDHRIGRVVQSNEHAIKRPIVSVLADEQGTMLAHKAMYQIDLATSPQQLFILRTLPFASYDSLDIMDGF
ncbi:MAG: HD-GYP domain-containing protein [Chitinispirillaceae bacterium]|nr:HD-GYP domain-containing protein [Chitinispirillaceae bacterium]